VPPTPSTTLPYRGARAKVPCSGDIRAARGKACLTAMRMPQVCHGACPAVFLSFPGTPGTLFPRHSRRHAPFVTVLSWRRHAPPISGIDTSLGNVVGRDGLKAASRWSHHGAKRRGRTKSMASRAGRPRGHTRPRAPSGAVEYSAILYPTRFQSARPVRESLKGPERSFLPDALCRRAPCYYPERKVVCTCS